MKIKVFFLFLFLLTNKLVFSQEFVTVDKAIYELVENVNYKLYKNDSLVYSNVTLSDKLTKISNDIEYDSITFSRIDYYTLGLPKDKIKEVVLLSKKTFALDEIVVESKKGNEIILGEKKGLLKTKAILLMKKME